MVDENGAGERPRRRNPIQWHGSPPGGGFAQIPNAFVRDHTLSAHARCVGALLFTHKSGFEVSAVSLAEAMDCSRPTATKALKELQNRGWLSIQEKHTLRGTRAFSIYHLHRSRPFTEDELAALRAGVNPPPQNQPPSAHKDESATDICASVHPVKKAVGYAETLVNCCMSAIPQKVRAHLIAPVQAMIDEGHPHAVIADALIRWQKRSDAGPGLLSYLVSDAIKERDAGPCNAVRDARVTWDMSDLNEFGYRWNAPDPPEGAKSAARVKAFMRQRKSEWLDQVSADIEQKWRKKIVGVVCAANPGVEQREVVKLLFS